MTSKRLHRKPSRKVLKAVAREEKRTSLKYKRWGFLRQGMQEASHAKFFEEQARESG